MKAKDIMTTDVPTIYMKTSVSEAVRLLRNNFGDESFRNAAPGLIVVNERGELAGIFTPLQIITHLLEQARRNDVPDDPDADFLATLCIPLKTMPVDVIMERQAISVTEEARVTEVANLFANHRFQRVPVVRDKKVIGIIYRSQLMFAMTESLYTT